MVKSNCRNQKFNEFVDIACNAVGKKLIVLSR